MIPAWLAKVTLPILVGLGLLLASAILAFATVRSVSSWLETYRDQIIAGRDGYWKAEIASASLQTARTEAAQLQAVISLESEAQAKLRAAEDRQAELERDNAALPNGDSCGLDRDRVRLLGR